MHDYDSWCVRRHVAVIHGSEVESPKEYDHQTCTTSRWLGTDSVPPSFKRRKVLNLDLRGELDLDDCSHLL